MDFLFSFEGYKNLIKKVYVSHKKFEFPFANGSR